MLQDNRLLLVVRIESENVLGVVMEEGAHFSLVHYYKEGIGYEEYVEVSDLVVLGQIGYQIE